MDELVANLIEAYRQSIIDARVDERRDPRARAREARRKFTPKIGYPVKWRDYSSLEIDAGDLLGNMRARARVRVRPRARQDRQADRPRRVVHDPADDQRVLQPGLNEIVFPAAILQYPFFDADRDAAANYGAHRRRHRPRDRPRLRRPGQQFDGDGRLHDWWTDADRAAFEKRTAALIEQYDALAPLRLPDHHVNGALTIGENIGDLGGLGIAWKAYLTSRSTGAEAPGASTGSPAPSASSCRGRRPGSRRVATTRPSACSRSTRTRPTSSAATRSCATSTSSTPRSMSPTPTRSGSSLPTGCASGSQGPAAP